MAQLGNVLRIRLENARWEAGGSPWRRTPSPSRVRLDYRADARHREGADWIERTVARGEITGEEVLHWAAWFAAAEQVRRFPTALGKTPTVPVARLWTPLAGPTVEFFLWPGPARTLALLALFTPDAGAPSIRHAVEITISAEELAAFGAALEREYEELRSSTPR